MSPVFSGILTLLYLLTTSLTMLGLTFTCYILRNRPIDFFFMYPAVNAPLLTLGGLIYNNSTLTQYWTMLSLKAQRERSHRIEQYMTSWTRILDTVAYTHVV